MMKTQYLREYVYFKGYKAKCLFRIPAYMKFIQFVHYLGTRLFTLSPYMSRRRVCPGPFDTGF